MFCGAKNETDMHVFISCWWSNSVLSLLNFESQQLHDGYVCMADWLFDVFKLLPVTKFVLLMVSLWLIWYHRNKVRKGNVLPTPDFVVRKCRSLFKNYMEPSCLRNVMEQDLKLTWKKPPVGFYKINCDASFCHASTTAFIAAICRDHKGVITGLQSDVINNCSSATEAEFRALALSFKLAVQKGLDRVVFETDSSTALNILYGKQNESRLLSELTSSCWTLLVRMKF